MRLALASLKKKLALYIEEWYNVFTLKGEIKMAKVKEPKYAHLVPEEAILTVTPEVFVPVVKAEPPPKPALTCSGYVMFKNTTNNTWYTVEVKFDQNLTTAEFANKEVAGDEKSLAIERLKILLATKQF